MNANADTIAPSTETQEFLARKHKLLIDGQWVDAASGDTITVEDPATEQAIGEVALGGAEDIDRAVAAARKALKGEWSKLSSHEKSVLYNSIRELYDDIHLAMLNQ